MVVRISDRLWLSAHNLEREAFNLRTLLHGQLDGVMATMNQSGTHWVCYMLSLILARLHDLPPPSYSEDTSIVGSVKCQEIPRIKYVHCPPHYLLRSRTLFRWLHLPRHLVLVRDLRDSLVSHYEKCKTEYNVDFSTYLRGGARREGGYRLNDIWVRIRFLNGWGAVVERQSEQAAVLKYEDLKADTRGQLARVCDHFNIEGVTPDLLDEVVAASSKAEMAKRSNPTAKYRLIRTDPLPADEWYSDEDRRFVAEVCRRHLKYTFGYRYW
jgi:hypothetical protein